MGYLYILSIVLLGIGFLTFKKSDEKQSFIKWLCIFLVGILAYNTTICMILGVLHIVQHLALLFLINIIISGLLLYSPIKKKRIQQYKCSKLEIISFSAVLIIFVVMFVKDLYIYKGDVTHFAIDSAIHYRAAKHYSENMQLFVFLEDKTFFNFNIMQTGAYINDGILMNVLNSCNENINSVYVYQLFETLVLFASGLSFYIFIIDKIKTKRGLIGSICLFGLYIYGYPYNSWIYGFSYLSVGIAMTGLLLTIVNMLFDEDKIRRKIVLPMIIMTSMGLIFSYCLFVPAVFASICIYIFIKELMNKDTKKYLKIFGKNTLIITGLLVLVTAFGIGYLFIPSFLIEGQTNLVDALQEDGGIYSEKYKNFIVFVPFAILYCFELVKRIKEKKIHYQDVFAVIMIGYFCLLYLGMLLGYVSPYYMLKTYFILWLVIFAVTAELINKYIDERNFNITSILLVAFYLFLVFGKIAIETGLRTGLILILILTTVLPQILKDKFDFKKLRISGNTFICIWTLFVCAWIVLKAGNVLPEEQKHSLPNLIGMYYSENCEYRKAIDLISNFNKNNIIITDYARENLSDMTADNTVLITEGYYRTLWAIATLEYESDNISFRKILNYTNQFNVKKEIKNENTKYVIRLDSTDLAREEECVKDIEYIENDENDNTELLLKNKNGYILKINR